MKLVTEIAIVRWIATMKILMTAVKMSFAIQVTMILLYYVLIYLISILQSQEHAKILDVATMRQNRAIVFQLDAILDLSSMMKMEICYHQVNHATTFLTVVGSMLAWLCTIHY